MPDNTRSTLIPYKTIIRSKEEFLIKKKLFAKIATVALATPLFFVNSGTGTVNAAESSTMVGYHCTGSAMGMIDVDIEMDVDIHANVPESVKSEEDFSIDNSYTEVSMGVTDILRTAANPLIGEVSQFELELDNANFNGSNTVDV